MPIAYSTKFVLQKCKKVSFVTVFAVEDLTQACSNAEILREYLLLSKKKSRYPNWLRKV